MLRKSAHGLRNRERGIALLAVLWGVVLLSVVALILTNLVQFELRTAAYQKEAAQAYAYACGGLEETIFQIVYGSQTHSQESDPAKNWRPGQREMTVRFRNGIAKVLIVNETAKLDLNFATQEELARMFEARGVRPNAARELAAAVVHWRGPSNPEDPEAAALDDYYHSRLAGGPSRHAPFGSLEEALRVRGMTRDLFYGTVVITPEGKVVPTYGVGQDLTIYSRSSLVNVNYASEQALESVPGIDPSWARAVVEERRHAPFESVTEITQRLPITVPDDALPFLTTNDGLVYSLVAVGEVKGSRVRRIVRAIVENKTARTDRYRILAWYDDDSSGMGVG
jgi:general secretion pathway protein K